MSAISDLTEIHDVSILNDMARKHQIDRYDTFVSNGKIFMHDGYRWQVAGFVSFSPRSAGSGDATKNPPTTVVADVEERGVKKSTP